MTPVIQRARNFAVERIHRPVLGFVRARLSPDGYLGLHLTIGAITLMVAVFIFGKIAEDVMTADSIVRMDLQLSKWFEANATPTLTGVFIFITELHSTPGALALSFLFALYLAYKRAWDWVWLVVVSVPLGMILNVVLKHVFQRARPTFEHPILTLTTYSFPSGHTAAATLLYGVVGAYLISVSKGWRRLLMVVLALLMVALVGLSRIYLGVHYLSDVLGAVASSTVWLAFTITAIATWRKRRIALALQENDRAVS
jgi:membrane-associated phospholipid phosphatase